MRKPASSPGNRNRPFAPSGFFALRTPLLPFDEFLSWSDGLGAEAAGEDAALLESALAADRRLLRRRLAALLESPVLRDALFVASPDLDESLDVWSRDPESERGQRIERAIIRYFSRMAGRPTPFGLFAGSSVGSTGDHTHLAIEGREKYRRRSRFDMDYLFALADAMGRDASLREAFVLRPNSSLYRRAGRVRYVESRLDGKNRRHHLVAAEDSEELRATLERAAGGASAASLAEALTGDEVSPEEARGYIGELVDSQILRSDLALYVTGPDPSGALADQLRGRPETSAIGAKLESARAGLTAIDAAGLGAEPAKYRAIARELGGLPAPAELPRLFQVDMVKSSPAARLGDEVLDELLRGLEILQKSAPHRRGGDLARFREAFAARYEGREVALVEALDEEAGIGYPPASGAEGEGGPLLEGIDFPPPAADPSAVPWAGRESFLLRKLTEAAAAGAAEISLEAADLERLGRKDPPPLPTAFSIMAVVAAASSEAISRGDFRIFWYGADGPSGARLLGRFCDADPILRDAVERHLRAEESLDPEAIFAEVVHLPQGRLGNVLFRPVMRDYEIPYMGRSGAPADRQIPVTDLLVSVSGGRVVLRSSRLGRRVIPRLTSAHNFRWGNLGLYRFLCELQEQDGAGGLSWDWGPLWSAPFLPRVSCGRLVFSPAQWTIGKDELKRLAGSRGAERFRAVQSLRRERRLPRLVLLADGDNRLPVDLSNVLSVESFVQLVKDRPEAKLAEMFPGPEELCAHGPEGRFLHELIVPFVRTESAAARAESAALSTAAARPPVPTPRRFPPGSEWLYAKLYAGAATADRLLVDIVGPLVAKAHESGAADRWFFIRYGDPDWHLRLRFHGEPSRLQAEVMPALREAFAATLEDGRVWKMQLDTYEREVERYGGPEGIILAERIFQADSEATLEILEMLEEGDEGADERWRLTLRGMDMLLGDFGLDRERKRVLVDQARRELLKNLYGEENAKRGFGARFRKESRDLDRLLDATSEQEGPLAPGLEVLRRRSERLAPIMEELTVREKTGRLSQPLAEIAPSFLHMHVNRMLRSAHRVQELVLYDFLARLHESQVMRARLLEASPAGT